MRRRLGRVGLGLLLATGVAAVSAHTGGSTGYAALVVNRGTVRYSLTLPTATLPTDLAEGLRLAQAGSPRDREALLDVIRNHVVLRANGARCEPGPGELLPAGADAASVGIRVDFACGNMVRELVVQDNVFDMLGADHHTLLKLEATSGTQEAALTPDRREARFVLDTDAVASATGSFFLIGIEHILSGYDHLLFLFGLLLPGGGLLSLAKIITAFTIAHSVTLSLAVLNVVHLPDRLIEAVIALSIAFVAAENVFFKPTVTRRWVLSFCFGLVHGFGFSSALRELGLPAHGLLLSLFGFNLGVEVGQGLVVVACLPVLALLHRTRWESRAVFASSMAILVVGLFMFAERVFL